MVGIGEYPKYGSLETAVVDSMAIANSLKKHGVRQEDIVYIKDCNIFELMKAFRAFVMLCSPDDLAFLFYEGHGCAINNKNQCLLARALNSRERVCLNQGQIQTMLECSIEVETMLAMLRKQGVTQHVLLLDCCCNIRNEDISRHHRKEEVTSPLNFAPGPGTIIGYSTVPGKPKPDRPAPSGKGYYTEALLKHMHKINTDVDYMLREVSKEVIRMTDGEQTPVIVCDSC